MLSRRARPIASASRTATARASRSAARRSGWWSSTRSRSPTARASARRPASCRACRPISRRCARNPAEALARSREIQVEINGQQVPGYNLGSAGVLLSFDVADRAGAEVSRGQASGPRLRQRLGRRDAGEGRHTGRPGDGDRRRAGGVLRGLDGRCRTRLERAGAETSAAGDARRLLPQTTRVRRPALSVRCSVASARRSRSRASAIDAAAGAS